MDLKELTAFQTILQEGTFSRAAEKLNYAQSTVTNQIQRLEKELGLQLFKRGWEVELTDAGRIFAGEVDKLIRHWSDVTELARALQQGEIGSLRMGAIEPLLQTLLPDSLRKFQEHKPRITCQLTQGNTEALSQALLQDELDFAICGEPQDSAAYYFEPLYQENIVFVADRSHPLCGASEVSVRDVLDYPLIAGGHTCLYYLQLTKHLSRYEVKPPLLHTVSQISAIPQFARQMSSVGVVLSSTPLIPEVQTIKVQWDAPVIPVGFLQLQGRVDSSASAKRLLMQLIRENI